MDEESHEIKEHLQYYIDKLNEYRENDKEGHDTSRLESDLIEYIRNLDLPTHILQYLEIERRHLVSCIANRISYHDKVDASSLNRSDGGYNGMVSALNSLIENPTLKLRRKKVKMEMEKKAVNPHELINMFNTIRDRAVQISQLNSYRITGYLEIVNGVIEGYNNAIKLLKQILDVTINDERKIGMISSFMNVSPEKTARGKLEAVITKCDVSIGSIKAKFIPLPKEQLDRLENLRSLIAHLSKENEKIGQHLFNAVDEFESGHYLASTLISGKVVYYALQKIASHVKIDLRSDDGLEKLCDILKEKKLIDRKDTESLMKTSKNVRHLFTHDLNIDANMGDALELLGQTINIVQIGTTAKVF